MSIFSTSQAEENEESSSRLRSVASVASSSCSSSMSGAGTVRKATQLPKKMPHKVTLFQVLQDFRNNCFRVVEFIGYLVIVVLSLVALSGLSEKISTGSEEKTLVYETSKFFEQCTNQCVQYIPNVCKRQWNCNTYCAHGLYANRQGIHVTEDGEKYHMAFQFNSKCEDNCKDYAKKTCEGDMSCQTFCRKEMKGYGFQVVKKEEVDAPVSNNALVSKHHQQQQHQQVQQIQEEDDPNLLEEWKNKSLSFWFIIGATFFLIPSMVRIVLCLDIICTGLNMYQQIQKHSPKGDSPANVKFYELLFEVDMKDLSIAKVGGSILCILMEVAIIFQSDGVSLLTFFLFFCVTRIILKIGWKLYKCYSNPEANVTASTACSLTFDIGQRFASLGQVIWQELTSSSSSSSSNQQEEVMGENNATQNEPSKEKSN